MSITKEYHPILWFLIIIVLILSYSNNICPKIGVLTTTSKSNTSTIQMDKINHKTSLYTAAKNNREIITGEQIKNVTIYVQSVYSQTIGFARVQFYFWNENQLNGTSQIIDSLTGKYYDAEGSPDMYGYPLKENASFHGWFAELIPNYSGYSITLFNNSIFKWFKTNGFAKSFFVVSNISASTQDADVGISIQFNIELKNHTMLYLRRGGTFGGEYARSLGSAGPYLQLEYRPWDVSYPKLSSKIKILPSNPSTEIDAILVQFGVTDNILVFRCYIVYEYKGKNYSKVVDTLNLLNGNNGSITVNLGNFEATSSIRIWIAPTDGSSWYDPSYNPFLPEEGAIVLTTEEGPDIFPPVIINFPSNNKCITISIGDPYNSTVKLIVYNENPDYVDILRNDTLINSQNWDNDGFKLSLTHLSPGYYEYKLIFYDSSGNSVSTTFSILARWNIFSTQFIVIYLIIIVLFLVLVGFVSIKKYTQHLNTKLSVQKVENSLLTLYLILDKATTRINILKKLSPLLSDKPFEENLSKSSKTTLMISRTTVNEKFLPPDEELLDKIKSLSYDDVKIKMIKILSFIAGVYPSYTSLSDITSGLQLPKSTVFRLLDQAYKNKFIEHSDLTTKTMDQRYRYVTITTEGGLFLTEIKTALEVSLIKMGILK